MGELYIRRERPNRAAVERALRLLHPAASLGRVSRLRGGLSNHMLLVRFRERNGEPGRFVLRLTSDWQRSPVENARREHTTLRRLREAGLPAPRPLLLDESGEVLGRPGLLISYEGKAVLDPPSPEPWLRGLAAALAALHQVTPGRFDLTHLDGATATPVAARVEAGLPPRLQDDPLAQAMLEALSRHAGRLQSDSPCLVHDDYWPGNVVWRRGRVGAIVDWTTAKVGDLRDDVSQCRLDLAMTHGLEEADAFLREYEAHTDRKLDGVWFFDLLRGIDALNSFRRWLPGYLDSGLAYMTEELAEARLRAFLQAALQSAA